MVRTMAVAAAAVGALAHSASAVSLREQLVQALSADAPRKVKNDDGELISCRYNKRDGDRDKFCEPYQTKEAAPMNGCSCREVCHVWGDPHLAPFSNSCSALVMDFAGRSTLWELPSRGPYDPGMKIEAVTEKVKGRHFIQEVYVDDKLFMSVAKDCDEKDDHGYVQRGTRQFQSDEAYENGKPSDVNVEYVGFCDYKKGPANIEVTISIDELQSNTGRKRTTLRPDLDDDVAASTSMFAHDTGLCTNPERKFNCDRESKFKSLHDVDGRECKCNAQCSIFGDPNVHSFFDIQGDKGRSFKLAPESSFSHGYDYGRVLYMVDKRFAVYAQMNNCEHIETIRILVNKDVSKTIGDKDCRPIGFEPDAAVLSLDEFETLEYSAEEICNGNDDFDAESRKSVTFPFGSRGERFLTEDLGGFDLGYYGTFDENHPDVRPYWSAEVSRTTKANSCKLPNGKAKFDSYLDMGGVRVTMKCHRTRKSGRARSTPFFNVCIERVNVSEETKKNNKGFLSRSAFADAEKQILTAGHCALGKNAERRGLDEYNHFEIKV